jgi:hypothetical protein
VGSEEYVTMEESDPFSTSDCTDSKDDLQTNQKFVLNPFYQPVSEVLDNMCDDTATDVTTTTFNVSKDVVNIDREGTQTPTSDENGDEGLSMLIPAVTTTKPSGSPAHVSIDVESQPSSSQQCSALTTSIEVENEAESAQLLHIYSKVQAKKVPPVPPKSSDLLQYLATRSVFNMGVYNEPINPSDFTSDGNHDDSEMETADSNPFIYFPIYTVPEELPDGFEQPLEIISDNIKTMKGLGIGRFGEVVLATTNGLSLKDMQLSEMDDKEDVSIHAVVKKMKVSPSPTEQEAFRMEAKFMSCLKHPNVVRLLGVCIHDPAFIMMEYMEEGDLSQFLQRYSEIVSIITCANNTSQITTSTLVFIASQIASAMKYLAAHNYIHRDLATRNCLVGGNFTIKLADFGMSRNLYESHYYRIQGNAILPIRWMATECFFGIFSEKTDVWAFGVTMWELFTLAKDRPHPALSDKEVIQNAFKGEYCQFPSKPEACPRPVYVIMERCWVVDMTQRATFQELHKQLQMCL